MPTVLIDLRMVQGRLHGIARYALELARRLPALAPPGWEFLALAPPAGLPAQLGELTPALSTQRAKADFLSLGEQLDLPRAIRRSGCDLFHATSFSVPALWSGRLVATLHDANHIDRAHEYGWKQAVYFAAVVGPRVRRAEALLTVSEFSRNSLAQSLDVARERFEVVHPGVDALFHPPAPDAISRIRRRHELPERYFLAVGNEKPFKNLALLARIAQRLTAPLVLLAGHGAAKRLGFPLTTIDVGEVAESDLPALYAGALALLLPSRHEGFGLPALEAMACGCPVLAARAGALPEVVGDAGCLLDPDDEEGWLREAAALASDETTRAQRARAGQTRAGAFGWEACARATFSTYQHALEAQA